MDLSGKYRVSHFVSWAQNTENDGFSPMILLEII